MHMIAVPGRPTTHAQEFSMQGCSCKRHVANHIPWFTCRALDRTLALISSFYWPRHIPNTEMCGQGRAKLNNFAIEKTTWLDDDFEACVGSNHTHAHKECAAIHHTHPAWERNCMVRMHLTNLPGALTACCQHPHPGSHHRYPQQASPQESH